MTLLAPERGAPAAPPPPEGGNPTPLQSTLGRYPLLGVFLGLGAGVGGLMAVGLHASGAVIPGLALALPIVYVALLEPLVALVMLVVVQWSNVSSVVGSHGGVSVYLLALAVAAISLVFGARRAGTKLFPRSPVYLLVAAAVVAEGLSLLASAYPLASLSTPVEHLKDVAFFFIALGLMQLTGRWATALRAIVITVAVLAGLSLIQQYLLHNSTTFGGLENIPIGADIGSATVRHSGPEADVNFWGRTIVLATAPALALLTIRLHQRRLRGLAVLWALAVFALIGGAYLTQSRGDLIAMLVLLVLWIVIAGWQFRRWLVLVPLVAAVIFISVPGISSRLGTLGQVTHLSSSSTDPSLVGRAQAQEVGLAMFESNPLTGVGSGNFQTVEPDFLTKPGVTDTGTVYAPHNLYLQIAAEQGIVGLGAWVLLFGGAMVLSLRAALLAGRLDDDQERLIALGCFVGLVAWGTASVVLHLADFNDLLAIIAVVAVADVSLRARVAAANALPGADRGVRYPRHRRSVGQRVAPWAVGAGVTALLGVGVYAVSGLLPLQKTMYRADATASVRPVSAPTSQTNAYTWGTVSRATLLPTLAGISTDPRFVQGAEQNLALTPAQLVGLKVTGSGDVKSATLDLRVTARSPGVAASVASDTLRQGRTYLGSLLSIYEVEPVTPASAWPVQVWQSSHVAVIVVLGLLSLVGGRVAAGVWRRRSRARGLGVGAAARE